MLRSLFSAITGLRNGQIFMDVIGNNISNLNTVAFRGSRITFQDLLSQTIKGASAPMQSRGGTNAIQIGLGSAVGSLSTLQSQGQLQATNRTTDLAIQGSGFFILSDGTRSYYTRDGVLSVGLDGTLLHGPSGLPVYGWSSLDASGEIDSSGPPGAIIIPLGQGMISAQTTEVTLSGNLDSQTATSGTYEASITVYDELGNERTIDLTFTKTADNTWEVTAEEDGTSLTTSPSPIPLTFTAGELDPPGSTPTVTLPAQGGAAAFSVDLDFTALTQMASSSNVTYMGDGATPGTLTNFMIGQSGEITGVYSNGLTRLLGQIALANFRNPAGLLSSGGNLFEVSANSGVAEAGVPGEHGLGLVSSGFLEMANVDMAQEFTSMIMAQRHFQASARVISTSDEILQDLVNIKR